jgi:hypothetical protein
MRTQQKQELNFYDAIAKTWFRAGIASAPKPLRALDNSEMLLRCAI